MSPKNSNWIDRSVAHSHRDLPCPRRAFIRAGARYLLMAGVVVLGTWLVRRDYSRTTTCPKPTRCERCRELTRCELPPAQTARRNLQPF
jgi:hypothetical protein